MTALFEVWEAHETQGYSWCKLWLAQEPVRLPLPWAREFARELFERNGLPVEVRGCGPTNSNKVRVQFGPNHWNQ